jgi:hypothetical protein
MVGDNFGVFHFAQLRPNDFLGFKIIFIGFHHFFQILYGGGGQFGAEIAKPFVGVVFYPHSPT